MKNVSFLWNNMYPLASAELVLFELDAAFFQSEKRVILPYSDVISRMETGASLTDNNVTGNNSLLHKNVTESTTKQFQSIPVLV